MSHTTQQYKSREIYNELRKQAAVTPDFHEKETFSRPKRLVL